MGLGSAAARLPVHLFGELKLPTQAIELGALVERAPGEIPVSVGVQLERSLRLRHRVGPFALQLQDLGAVDEALTAIRDKVRLRGAPLVQRLCPFFAAPQIEDALTGQDHCTVDDACGHRRYLLVGDDDHCLVELRYSLGDPLQLD